MPLKISIDVDGTLLGESGQLVPGAEAALRTLKDKRHQLQLWSLGGADYAQKIAKEHHLTKLFESYATKPDVAIDDLPETASPSFVLKVNQQQTLVDAVKAIHDTVEGCVESVLCPSLRVQALVAEMQSEAAQVRKDYDATILWPGTQLHPVPFFGNIEGARFVTIGLNPSSTEFDEWRGWPQSPMPVDALTHRLVNYFRLAHNSYPPPHKWFSEIIEASYIIKCPHKIAYAHVDLCPWTSLSPTALGNLAGGKRRVARYWNFIDEQLNANFHKVVGFLKETVRLVVVLQSDNPSRLEIDRQQRIAGLIRETLGPERSMTVQVENLTRDQLPEWAWGNKEPLGNLINFPSGFA